MKILIYSVLFCVCLLTSGAPERRVVCYFTSWTVYRPGNGKFDVPNVDPTLCTHILYSFVGLKENGELHILDDWEANGLKGIERLIALKKKTPKLKVMVSMGGWNEGSTRYSQVAADPNKRSVMVHSTLNFIKNHSFDGFDLDWEYPNQRGGVKADVKNFIKLLSELKEALATEGCLLSVAVAGAGFSIDKSYDITGLFSVVDFVNVMAYDYHGTFDNYVGHLSPLYASHLDVTEIAKQLNVADGVEHWIKHGAEPQKMNLGLALYGRTFTLANPNNSSLYAPINGGGAAGPYTRQAGVIGYNEICEFHSGMPDVWDDEQKVPHKLQGNQWYGYENEKSLTLKVQFALSKNLGGVMVWSLDTDDFKNVCNGGPYPLMKAINHALGLENMSYEPFVYLV